MTRSWMAFGEGKPPLICNSRITVSNTTHGAHGRSFDTTRFLRRVYNENSVRWYQELSITQERQY